MSEGLLTVGTKVNLASLQSGMAEAQLDVRRAAADMASAYKQLGAAAASGNKQAVAALVEQQDALNAAKERLREFTAATRQASASTETMTSNFYAAQGAAGILEGRIPYRAMERFLANSQAVSRVLQTAFPVMGALALVGVLGEAASKVGALMKAFEDLDGAEIKAGTDAIIAGEKIIRIHASHFDTNAFARFAEGAPAQKDIVVKNASAKLKEIQQSRELADAQAAVNEQSKTGVALQQQKIADAKQDIEYAKQAKDQADALVTAYKGQLEAKITVEEARVDPKSGVLAPARQINAITDPKQVAAIQQQLKVAVEASQEFSHQIDMAKVKLAGAHAKLPKVEDTALAKKTREVLALYRQIDAQNEKIARDTREIANQEVEIYGSLKKQADLTNSTSVMGDLKAHSEDQLKNLKQQVEQYRLIDDAIIRNASDTYRAAAQRTQSSVDQGVLNPQARISILQQAAAQEYAAQVAAITKKENLDVGFLQKYQADLNRQEQLTQAYYQKQAQLASQASILMVQPYHRALAQINQDFNASVESWLRGTERFGQAFTRMGDNLAISFTNNLLRMGEDYLRHEIMKRAIHQATMMTQEAQDATAAATSSALTAKTSLEQTNHYAVLAAAKAWSALAGIPIVGPALGAVAAGATYAGIMALASFDKGTSFVPRDGVAMLHRGEAVLPPPQTSELRSALSGRGSRGGNEIHFHDHTSVNALDGPSVQGMMSTHAQAGRREMYRQLRKMNLVQ